VQKFQDVVLDSQGRPVAGAVIAVLSYPGGSPATVYQTDAVGTAYTPTTDDYGAFYFYAPNGHYSYTVSVSNVLRGTVTDILLYDPEEIEGSWTPTDISGGTAVLSVASGEYIKTGSIVYVSGRIRFASTGDSTSAAFSGLPYTAKDSINVYALVCSAQGNTYGTTISGITLGGLVFAITPGTKNFTPRWADIPGLICTNGQLDVTTVYFTGWYPTDE
jgi:hypothetical protein